MYELHLVLVSRGAGVVYSSQTQACGTSAQSLLGRPQGDFSVPLCFALDAADLKIGIRLGLPEKSLLLGGTFFIHTSFVKELKHSDTSSQLTQPATVLK